MEPFDSDLHASTGVGDCRHGIIRDKAYVSTVKRDFRRQRLRRLTHRLASVYERTVWYPRWCGAARQLTGQATGQRLSTCIITMNGAHRIVPLLRYIRSFSHEIVVGVDSKTTDDTLAVCEGLADELFVIDNDAQTCNGGLEALVARCHGDWVLRLDDDEFPEPHLASLLPGLMASHRFTHYKLPRLHLALPAGVSAQTGIMPGHLRWINDGYLYPDFQMRLFKNDPGLLSFPGAVGHSSIACSGRRGKVNTVNLVHLNMAINPRARREAKLKTYIHRLNGGWVHPVNEYALLYEDYHYRLVPYQYEDEGFLQAVVETLMAQRLVYELAHPSEPRPPLVSEGLR